MEKILFFRDIDKQHEPASEGVLVDDFSDIDIEYGEMTEINFSFQRNGKENVFSGLRDIFIKNGLLELWIIDKHDASESERVAAKYYQLNINEFQPQKDTKVNFKGINYHKAQIGTTFLPQT